jgi:hypothetical protein
MTLQMVEEIFFKDITSREYKSWFATICKAHMKTMVLLRPYFNLLETVKTVPNLDL